MLRYRLLFYPLVGQTLATVSTLFDDPDSERVYTRTYTLKTLGDEAWPVAMLLRELADKIDAEEF